MMSKLEDIKALELYLEGKNDREIAEETGVSRDAVHKWRKRNGLISVRQQNDVLEGYSIPSFLDPLADTNSLYHDVEFLEKEILRRKIRR